MWFGPALLRHKYDVLRKHCADELKFDAGADAFELARLAGALYGADAHLGEVRHLLRGVQVVERAPL